jgi:DNA sulfur modification protein DndC
MMARTLFDAQRLTLEEAMALTEGSLAVYGETHRHWRVAFSGGKDSSAALTAVSYLIESGRVPRPLSLGALYADTRLELPNLHAAAMGMLAEARARGWTTEVVYPLLDKRWFVMMLGRGIPPSHSGFRWCTGALKVDPMATAMRRAKDQTGEKLLLITGMRIGESANRDRRIALSCGKDGGECGQGWYEQTTPAEVADVLSPLLHWRTCHVWDWLQIGLEGHGGGQHGFDCAAVANVYGADEDGSEAEILSRTGCLVCPVASRDYALERTVKKPEWAYLAPMLRLRALYEDLTRPHSRLRKVGERTASGKLSSNPNRLGPLTMEARKKALAIVLDIQGEINMAAILGHRPPVLLINAEELARIEELIERNTWPDKWDGTEPRGDSITPQVMRDGSVQGVLFTEDDFDV